MPFQWDDQHVRRPGIFIKDYLSQHGQASIAEMHQAYTRRIKEENLRRKQLRKATISSATYHSFYAYFRALLALELVERIGDRDEGVAITAADQMGFAERVDGKWRVVQGARERLWRLTGHGHAEVAAWRDPWRHLSMPAVPAPPPIVSEAEVTPAELFDKWADRKKNILHLEMDIDKLDPDAYNIGGIKDIMSTYRAIEPGEYASTEEYQEGRDEVWEEIMVELEALGVAD